MWCRADEISCVLLYFKVTWGGGTKALDLNFSVKEIFDFAKKNSC